MSIPLPDGRLLSDDVLDALRLRALRGRELGFTECDLAELLGVTRETICRWWSAYCHGGIDALPHHRPGRPQGSGRLLTDPQARFIQAILDRQLPRHFDIALPLWTRAAVAELIQQQLGIVLAVRTVGAYLQRWGYTPQRPARKSRKQDPKEVRRWMETTYPALAQRVQEEGAELLWCDETGVRMDDARGRGYARPGHTPLLEVSETHGQVNVLSAIGNTGESHFMTFQGTLDAAVFVVFLGQLLQGTSRKIFLVVDGFSVHTSAAVQGWVTERSDRIELIPLPKYSPELNPVEYLNNDIKGEVNEEGLPHDEEELHDHVDSFLHKISSWPARILSYFFHPAVQYAAADNL